MVPPSVVVPPPTAREEPAAITPAELSLNVPLLVMAVPVPLPSVPVSERVAPELSVVVPE